MLHFLNHFVVILFYIFLNIARLSLLLLVLVIYFRLIILVLQLISVYCRGNISNVHVVKLN